MVAGALAYRKKIRSQLGSLLQPQRGQEVALELSGPEQSGQFKSMAASYHEETTSATLPTDGISVSESRAPDRGCEGAPAYGRVDTGSGFGRVACG